MIFTPSLPLKKVYFYFSHFQSLEKKNNDADFDNKIGQATTLAGSWPTA
jgi:hypothetical protein